MSERFESWFKIRRRIKAVEMMREHAAVTVQVVDELLNCVNASLKQDPVALKASYGRQEQKEKEGDEWRTRISMELAKGELPSEERDYLMRVVRQMDLVADHAHGAGRVLTFLPLTGLPSELRACIVEMCKTVRECSFKLQQCISKLIERDPDAAIRLCEEVERLEEATDAQHMDARRQLFLMDVDKGGAVKVVFVSSLLTLIEDTADRCEDTCDQIRIFLVSYVRSSVR